MMINVRDYHAKYLESNFAAEKLIKYQIIREVKRGPRGELV